VVFVRSSQQEKGANSLARCGGNTPLNLLSLNARWDAENYHIMNLKGALEVNPLFLEKPLKKNALSEKNRLNAYR